MAKNGEIEKVRHGTLEQALAGPDPIDEVTHSASHDQTEGDIV